MHKSVSLELTPSAWSDDYIVVRINGVSLGRHIADAKRLGGEVESSADQGISWRYVDSQHSQTAFDRATLVPGFRGRVLLFTCAGCGTSDCHDTLVHVESEASSVVWRSITTAAGVPLPAPVLAFDREQFAVEVRRIHERHLPSSWTE